jgi:hypothetical protein
MLDKSTKAPPPDLKAACGLRHVDEDLLKARLAVLREEHQDLDAAIAALIAQPATDQLRIQRLKKKKLLLKDEISRIEDALIPDIIA